MDATPQDKNGLDRSVLSYIDVSLQPKGKLYLIVDEGMGQKALFSIDQLEVKDSEIIGYRDTPAVQVVVRFSPLLAWRAVHASEIYIQDSRTVYAREAAENKEMHEMTLELRKQLKIGHPEAEGEGVQDTATKTGQYL